MSPAAGKAYHYESNVPLVTSAVGVPLFGHAPAPTIDELLEQLQKEEITSARAQKLVEELRLRTAEQIDRRRDIERRLGYSLDSPAVTASAITKHKRFTVINGEVIRDDETGDYSLAEAAQLARTQRGGSDNYADVIKAVLDKMQPGDMLSNYIALAEHLTPQSVGVSESELAARLENMQLKNQIDTLAAVKAAIQEVLPKRKDDEDREPPFISDSEGHIMPNPKGRLTVQDMMVWQALRPKSPRDSLQDEEGRIIPVSSLDSFLKLQGFRNEQRREDEKVGLQREAAQIVRERLPEMLGLARDWMGPSREERDSLRRGGWAPPEQKRNRAGRCPSCGGEFEYVEGTKVLDCPGCGGTCWLGKPEDFKREVQRWMDAVQQQGESPVAEEAPVGPEAPGATPSSQSGEPSGPTPRPSKKQASTAAS